MRTDDTLNKTMKEIDSDFPGVVFHLESGSKLKDVPSGPDYLVRLIRQNYRGKNGSSSN